MRWARLSRWGVELGSCGGLGCRGGPGRGGGWSRLGSCGGLGCRGGPGRGGGWSRLGSCGCLGVAATGCQDYHCQKYCRCQVDYLLQSGPLPTGGRCCSLFQRRLNRNTVLDRAFGARQRNLPTKSTDEIYDWGEDDFQPDDDPGDGEDTGIAASASGRRHDKAVIVILSRAGSGASLIVCQHWGGPSGGLSLYPAQCGDLCITAFVTDKLSHPARKTLALWDPGSSTAAGVGQHVYGVYWGSTPTTTSSSRPLRTAQITSSCFVPMPSLSCMR